MIGLGRLAEWLSPLIGLAIEADAVLSDTFERDVLGFPYASHAEEFFERSLIPFDGPWGPVELDLEVFEEPSHEQTNRIGRFRCSYGRIWFHGFSIQNYQ